MTISGTVKNPRSLSSRSNSASEAGSPGSKMTTPRSGTPRTATPRNISRQTSKERSKERNIGKTKQESASEKEPREISAPSANETLHKEALGSKPPSNCPSGHLFVDTRSKTVNSVCPGNSSTATELIDVLNNAKLREKTTRPGAGKVVESKGYGKPMVTPVNRRLTIRRDQPWPYDSCKDAEKVTPLRGTGTKFPNRKADKKETPSQNATLQRQRGISTKIPTKVTVSGNKLRESNTNPFPDTKIPILRAHLGARSLRASSSIHSKRSNSRSPQRHQKATEKYRDYMSTPTYKLKLDNHDSPEIKRWTEDRNKTPPRSWNRCRSPGSPMRNRMSNSEAKRKSPTPPSKDENIFAENSKPSNREISSPPLNRPTPPGHSNRSFKPQLEDIKSSYLLINKISQESAKTVTKADKNANKISQVISQFNEERRRHKLKECKKNFQSSRFFEDSRFEKIEGLNWITWK